MQSHWILQIPFSWSSALLAQRVWLSVTRFKLGKSAPPPSTFFSFVISWLSFCSPFEKTMVPDFLFASKFTLSVRPTLLSSSRVSDHASPSVTAKIIHLVLFSKTASKSPGNDFTPLIAPNISSWVRPKITSFFSFWFRQNAAPYYWKWLLFLSRDKELRLSKTKNHVCFAFFRFVSLTINPNFKFCLPQSLGPCAYDMIYIYIYGITVAPKAELQPFEKS